MNITEVRIKVVNGEERVRAFCSITIDGSFVVRELKLIEGEKGIFLAMPSRKLTNRCDNCGDKVPILKKYCGDCGHRVLHPQTPIDPETGRKKLHADIAHPVSAECREEIFQTLFEAYRRELQTPGTYSS